MTTSHHETVPSLIADLPLLVGHGEEEPEDEQVCKLGMRLMTMVSFSMVLKSALELGIIDVLRDAGDDTLSCPVIAEKISAGNPDAPGLLDRMLRLLASYGVVKGELRETLSGEAERVYGAGPVCRFLGLKEEDGGEWSIAPLILICLDKVYIQSWFRMNEVVMEGGAHPFKKEHGMNVFEYPAVDQRFNTVFNRGMSSNTTFYLRKLLDVYRGFNDIKVLVDVGGGIGNALGMITSACPHIKGINYDLPHVVETAPSYPGVEHVGGDMFKSVPQGDAIFMKCILHDWGDENSSILLKNCYRALPKGGKVIVVELILPEAPAINEDSSFVCGLDIFMFTMSPTGKERTLKEYESLATKAGFAGCEIKCRSHNSYVMEFLKA